jgi:GTP-binding protein
MDTLAFFTRQQHFRAKAGEQGRGKSMHGKGAGDVIVPVPIGTLVYDHETEEFIADLSEPGAHVVVAQGGEGGLGNERFKTATNQAPREFTPGGPAIDRILRLELKLLADVGLIGLPNAGKSTLLRAVSRARPKVADYPFTTLSPALGIAELTDRRRLVIADLPGLIAGAANGAGLGHDFLRHVERTKLLLHVIDAMPADESDPLANYQAVRREIAEYSPELAQRPELIAINKLDVVDDDARAALLARFAGELGVTVGVTVLGISGATGEGVPKLLEACWALLDKPDRPAWTTQVEQH